jgi:PAS domain S-box-containing protein
MRQLRRADLSTDRAPSQEQWQAFLESVERTYTSAEQDRYTLERSLSISSREMRDLYEDLKRSSESQLAEEHDKLKLAVAIHEAILEAALDGVLVLDQERRVISYSKRFTELWGIADNWLEIPDPAARMGVVAAMTADPEQFIASIERVYARPFEPSQDEIVLADGRTIDRLSAPILSDTGECYGRVWFFRDVTSRKQRETKIRDVTKAALRASEERHRLLFEASPLPTWVFDPQTLRLLAVNEAAVVTFGYSRDELVAMTVSELKPKEDLPELHGMEAALFGRTHHVGIKRYRRKDTTIAELDITSHATMLDGRLVLLAIGVDVTQSRLLEEQLRQSQKMEAVGQLAGGVAHDFNNILSVILSNAELALETIGNGPAATDLHEIEAAAHRAASLTRQLLTFSRKQPRHIETIALNSVVTNIEKMLTRIVGEDIVMSAILMPRLGSIAGDTGQLEQVLVNLVVNARDAMPAGGRLTIETSNVTIDDADAAHLAVAPGRFIMLSVSDTGCGMDEATQARIFDPFFTTKEVGKGTGLGLSTVFGIVKQSEGGIVVHSRPGEGSTFRVYFPRATTAADAHTPELRSTVRARGSGTVLVVEDDEGLRKVLRRRLNSWGFSMCEARDAAQALVLLHELASPVDLLLTDLVMPGLDGRALAARVRADRPQTKVLFMSGYTEHPAVKTAAHDPGEHFIAKPFTGDDLFVAVCRALGV